MPISHYDALIIGAGQAGPALAVDFAKKGFKTVLVEKSHFGGTCVNNGCTPTKAMIASARAIHLARRGAEYGFTLARDLQVDMARIKARKDELVKASRHSLREWLKNTYHITLYRGHARFTDHNTVQVNEDIISADRIFLNVGARPAIPGGFESAEYLTNESIIDLDFVPPHLIIVGGSYVGLEFAQMFRRFGSAVTVVEKQERIISKEDPDVSAAVQEILKKEGIRFRLKAHCLGGKGKSGHITVDVDCESGDPQETGTHLLLATGRTPNTDDLGIDKAGIQLNEKGYIQVDDALQTSVAGIWALGKCNGKGAFTHTAYNDYEIVSANLLDNGNKKVTERILSYALYTDPPLARIGKTEQQVRAEKIHALMATYPMSSIARAKEKGETEGFIKILVDADAEQIIGASILGIEGDEVIHSLLDMMYAQQSYKVIQRTVPIHPTVSELLPTILQKLAPLP
ncbi:MAG: FAD-containing oxidoreductase [Saprospiraceae bacterium]